MRIVKIFSVVAILVVISGFTFPNPGKRNLSEKEKIIVPIYFSGNYLDNKKTSSSPQYFLPVSSTEAGSEVAKIEFSWVSDSGEVYSTALPIGKIKIEIDESRQRPTVEFFLEKREGGGGGGGQKNFNDDIEYAYAVVRISKSSLKREMYLPKKK